ncbi:hypothetical protein VTO42DRAFT_5513 [Malbranchea cinnamomea]
MALNGGGADMGTKDEIIILVTGTNSGVGLSICRRLIDEFLTTRPETQALKLIFTTRSSRKSTETLTALQRHLHASPLPTSSKARVTLRPEQVDLCDLVSVRALSRRLLSSLPKIDVLILNAGIAGFTGIKWFRAMYMILTDLVHALTWPSSYTISKAGMLTKKQTSLPDEPPLGQIFCANVFGHYMLSHNLARLLSKSTDSPGRIIWTSSLEATREVFDINDIQALQSPRPYEAVKYLTDLLSLTCTLPSTSPWVDSFLSIDNKNQTNSNGNISGRKLHRPNIYVAHPGVCATSIMPLMLPLVYAMLCVTWLARLAGSPWHLMSSYRGAVASVWLALSPQSVLDAAEAAYTRLGGGKVKWGSSCDRLGRESVVCTEVEGWGFGGVIGGPVLEQDKRRRRKRGAVNLTAEQRVEFEELGRKCWREMEELRVQWEAILDRAEMAESSPLN